MALVTIGVFNQVLFEFEKRLIQEYINNLNRLLMLKGVGINLKLI